MRSATPKLLHPLCGRPMIAWPVAAAREAGAGKDRRRRRPRPARSTAVARRHGVIVAVQQEPRGTADAVRAAAEHIDPDAHRDRAHRRRAADHAPRRSAALVDAHERDRRRGDDGDRGARRPEPATAASCARPDGTVERVVETKAPGDATEPSSHIREVNTGIFAFDGARAARRRSSEVGSDNAQGELLPARRAADPARARAHGRRPRDRRPGDDARDQRPRRRWPRSRALAQRRIHERHMLAGVTIVDPSATVIDVDVEIGQDTVIAPFTSLHGATTIGAGCDDRAARDADRHARSATRRRSCTRTRRGATSATASASARSPTCAPARCCARARRRARSSRSRTPTSAPARRSRTCPTSATPTSARARTSAPARSPPTTTGTASTARRSGRGCKTSVDTTLVAPVTRRRRRLHGRRLGDHQGRARRRARRRARAPAATSRATPSAASSARPTPRTGAAGERPIASPSSRRAYTRRRR